MEKTNKQIVIEGLDKKARLILDWDDGQWYISSIQDASETKTDKNKNKNNNTDNTISSTDVKVAEWNKTYKYVINDIVAFEGNLFVSKQNQNKNNKPTQDKFWWRPLIDLSDIDAATLEGANVQEIVKLVLGGNSISDYYTKSEINEINLHNLNNVDAKKLNGSTKDEIKEDYEHKIELSYERAKSDAINYFTNESDLSYQKSLIKEFEKMILPDNVNKT